MHKVPEEEIVINTQQDDTVAEIQYTTYDKTLEYEVTREIITLLHGIVLGEYYDEKRKIQPDAVRLKQLGSESLRLHRQRDNLADEDYEYNEKLSTEYGKLIRSYYNGKPIKVGSTIL
ncbi:MAG: hypothetical protein LBR53_07565 [Deltaproteobacteria bacterium]|jgi:hypothetical protein|nr:hypothetical protein [Deltaproteobacteria bacterium]